MSLERHHCWRSACQMWQMSKYEPYYSKILQCVESARLEIQTPTSFRNFWPASRQVVIDSRLGRSAAETPVELQNARTNLIINIVASRLRARSFDKTCLAPNRFSTCSKYIAHLLYRLFLPCDAIWRHKSGSTLANQTARCLAKTSHQCWIIIS